MIRFLLRKLPSALLVVFVSSIIAFILPRMAPGDPAVVLAGEDATPEQLDTIRETLGLSDPLWQQYLRWLGNVLRGDFGDSYVINRPVFELISARWASTIELALLATVIMIVIGLTLGLLAGSPRSKFSRTLLDVLTTVFLGTPSFLTGLLLILLLGIIFPILPVSGEVSLLEDPVIGIQYLILPATALALPPAAFVARLVATQMIMVRGEEFIDLAVAKGVPSRQIMTRHVMRNSLGTAAVAIGLRFGDLLGGAIVVEAIFARNGLGTLAVTSVNTRDYFVVQVLILGSVIIAVIVQLLSEIALAALDPRVRLDSR